METLVNVPTENQQLILSLIKDDLINSKLINNLNDMGIDASNYSLNLRTAILKLMGFESVNDQTHEKYSDFTFRAKDINFLEQPQLLNPLALEIYNFLDGLDRISVPTEKPFVGEKRIVIDLIKQDLINYKMIDLMGSMQISAEDYLLDIGRIVFEIMNIEEREDAEIIFEKYASMSKAVLEMRASQSSKEIDALASEMYAYLENLKLKAE